MGFLDLLHYLTLAISALVIIIQIIIAKVIFDDAKKLIAERKPLVFLSPGLWALAALVGGVMTLIAYWLFHYSTLRSKENGVQSAPQDTAAILENMAAVYQKNGRDKEAKEFREQAAKLRASRR